MPKVTTTTTTTTSVRLYMLYVSGRAYLWHQPTQDDKAAKKKARQLLEKAPMPHGKLYTGPTGVDEMDFVGVVSGVGS